MQAQLEFDLPDMPTIPEPTGAELRDQILDELAATEDYAPLVRKCQRIVLETMLSGKSVTADDLKDYGTEKRRGWVGAVFRKLAKEKVIKCTSYQQSENKTNHARPVGVWVCIDTDRARQWLIDNPEIES